MIVRKDNSLILISSPKWNITTTIDLKISSPHIKPSSFYLAIPRSIARRQRVIQLCTSSPSKIVDDENSNQFLLIDVPDCCRNFRFTYHTTLKLLANSYDENKLVVTRHSKRFLQAEKGIEVGHPEIENLAQQIQTTNPILIIGKAIEIVHKTLNYKLQKQEYGALYAIENGEGDCTEYACLLVALLRTKGISSRIALGYLQNQELHAIAEVYLNFTWIPIDVTHTRKLFLGSKNFIVLMQGNWLQQGGKEQVATFYYKTDKDIAVTIKTETQVSQKNLSARSFPFTISFPSPQRNICLQHNRSQQTIVISNNEKHSFSGTLLLVSASCVWQIFPVSVMAKGKQEIYYQLDSAILNYQHVLKWCIADKNELEICSINF